MKVSERTGMWVELDKSGDSDDEITVRVPNSIWAGWMMPIHLKDDDVAAFLRSIGWRVDVPHTTRCTISRTAKLSAGSTTGDIK